jgi:hypothetical protein
MEYGGQFTIKGHGFIGDFMEFKESNIHLKCGDLNLIELMYLISFMFGNVDDLRRLLNYPL